MSEHKESIPPELEERFKQEAPTERQELEHVWHLLEQTHPAPDDLPTADETWAHLQSRLERSSAPPRAAADRAATGRAPHRRPARRLWRGWAAAACIVAATVGGIWLWQQPVRVAVPTGEQVTTTLPDGSTVELSGGTTLSYRRGFGRWLFGTLEQRVVRLRGEAFFKVEHSPPPFSVKTFNARVEVQGTRFNVRAWPESTDTAETQVTLASGQVQVTAQARSSRVVTLARPGQTARVVGAHAPPTAPQDTSIARVLAWRHRGFAVANMPLPNILTELERRYGATVTLHDPTASTVLMTLFYPKRTDLETILHDICVAQDLNYRVTNKGYELFREAPSAVKQLP